MEATNCGGLPTTCVHCECVEERERGGERKSEREESCLSVVVGWLFSLLLSYLRAAEMTPLAMTSAVPTHMPKMAPALIASGAGGMLTSSQPM